MSTTCELFADRRTLSGTTRVKTNQAAADAQHEECGESIDNLLGMSPSEFSDLSSRLESSFAGSKALLGPTQMPPLGLINACPLYSGDTINSEAAALAVFEQSWLSALSAMHIIGHRFAKAAVDSEIDLHRVFHPLWRQTTNLAFAAELLARVTRLSESRASWLAGLCCGVACLSSAIQSAKPDSTSPAGAFPPTTLLDIDRLTRELQIDSLIPVSATNKAQAQQERVWRIATTAAALLQEAGDEDEWMLIVPREIETIYLPKHIRGLIRDRLSGISAESQRMNSLLWRSPLKPAH